MFQCRKNDRPEYIGGHNLVEPFPPRGGPVPDPVRTHGIKDERLRIKDLKVQPSASEQRRKNLTLRCQAKREIPSEEGGEERTFP